MQRKGFQKGISQAVFKNSQCQNVLSLCGYVLLAISAKQSANRLLAELKISNASLLLTVAQIVMLHCVWNHAFVFSTQKRIVKNISWIYTWKIYCKSTDLKMDKE